MKLTNTLTGMVINVADEKVGRFGSEWVPSDDEGEDTPTKPPAAKKAAAKK